MLCKLGCVTKNLDTVTLIGIDYRLDDDTSWTAGGALGSGDSPYEEIAFSAGVSCRRVQFRIKLQGEETGTDNPPIIEQMDLFYQTLPEVVKTHQLILDAGGNSELKEAGLDERSGGEIMEALRGLVGDTSFTYLDPVGASHTVRVTALTAQVGNLITGPGPAAVESRGQVIVNLLEL